MPGIASSVAAITAAVQKLQPLLQRAQKLRASRQPLSALQNGEDGQVQLCVCCQSYVLYALSTYSTGSSVANISLSAAGYFLFPEV